jgi:hypothetical protein
MSTWYHAWLMHTSPLMVAEVTDDRQQEQQLLHLRTYDTPPEPIVMRACIHMEPAEAVGCTYSVS